jgi:hypothetical protein
MYEEWIDLICLVSLLQKNLILRLRRFITVVLDSFTNNVHTTLDLLRITPIGEKLFFDKKLRRYFLSIVIIIIIIII